MAKTFVMLRSAAQPARLEARSVAAVALLSAFTPALASAAIVVERPEIRASLGTQPTTAAYMVIRNTGSAPDKLVGASCACAAMVMTHMSTVVNGVASMSMEHAVTIPAGGAVAFTPTGRHLMITGVKARIAAGAKVPITLQFEKAGRLQVAFSATATPGMGEHP